MKDLSSLREQINEIDETLVKLFLQRMEIVTGVAEYKKRNSMEVLDRSREDQIINKHLENISDENQRVQLKEFLESLMYISRKAQKKILNEDVACEKVDENEEAYKIGFQGVEGSYSHQALIEYFGDKIETEGFLNFKDVFEALKRDEIKYGILPIENSSTGAITEVSDLLGEYNFYIVGEKCIKVDHNLLGVEGTELSDIEEVYSHTQGFLQCTQFFDKHSNWRLIPYYNTARSAEYISKENSKKKACVASKQASEVYGLKVLEENINNSSNNHTRFIVIGKNIECNEQSNKVSVVIALPHKIGSLHSILKNFVDNNSNMVKIESRPIVDKAWEYFFYIDFDGNILDANTKNTLKSIEEESLYFKLLGNYKSEVICK